MPRGIADPNIPGNASGRRRVGGGDSDGANGARRQATRYQANRDNAALHGRTVSPVVPPGQRCRGGDRLDAPTWLCDGAGAVSCATRFGQLCDGALHDLAHAQALNPSRSGSGADGAPITLLFELTKLIRSEDFSFAAAPFTVP